MRAKFQSHIGPISTIRSVLRRAEHGACFNPILVRFQRGRGPVLHEAEHVSIPYWSDFNGTRASSHCAPGCPVSIPYWSDFNWRICPVLPQPQHQTQTHFSPVSIPYWSDFNAKFTDDCIENERFQSHIGPISTRRPARCPGLPVIVSIPYWSDFNKLQQLNAEHHALVSIPYWSDFNLMNFVNSVGMLGGRFNPILVRFQLTTHTYPPPVFPRFQSHIGPISTRDRRQ